MGTFIVIAIIALVVVLDIKYIQKNGMGDCTGSCGTCSGACHWQHDIKKAQRSIARRKKIREFFHLQKNA